MKWFYNLKVGFKLIISFLIVAIISGVVGVVGITNIQKIAALDTDMYMRHTATLPYLADVARTYQRQRVVLRNLYIEKDISKRQNDITTFQEQKTIISESMEKFEAGIKDDRVRKEFDVLTKTLADFD